MATAGVCSAWTKVPRQCLQPSFPAGVTTPRIFHFPSHETLMRPAAGRAMAVYGGEYQTGQPQQSHCRIYSEDFNVSLSLST